MKAIICGILIFSLGVFAQDSSSESEAAFKHSVSIVGSYFSLSSESAQASGFGEYEVDYNYLVHGDWKAFGSYNFILKGSSDLGGSVSGFSIGALYCVFGCGSKIESSEGLELISSSDWGMELGLGISNRSFQLENGDISLSGPVGRAEVLYFYKHNLRFVGSFKYSSLTNADQSLDVMSAGLGIRYFF